MNLITKALDANGNVLMTMNWEMFSEDRLPDTEDVIDAFIDDIAGVRGYGSNSLRDKSIDECLRLLEVAKVVNEDGDGNHQEVLWEDDTPECMRPRFSAHIDAAERSIAHPELEDN